jgi:chromate transporter
MRQCRVRLSEIAQLFLKLGFTAFGGPAVHIALMEAEVVERRRWLSAEHFLDLIGATNLIPGPNSTELALHVGYECGGWRGLFVAGISFLCPAVLLTALLGWIYTRWGALPEAGTFMNGIKAGVISIIAVAVWKLGKKAIKGSREAVLGCFVAIAVLFGADEVIAFFAGGIGGMIWLWIHRTNWGKALCPVIPIVPFISPSGMHMMFASAREGVSLTAIGLFFLKIGAILYGSGYVLIAFIEGTLVTERGWLTHAELLDAVALGQLTPGPVLSTATFIGYLLAGFPGAVVATLGIFFPSFLFVLILNPLIPRLRKRKWTAAFLDAVNVSALGLMAAVTLSLARHALETPAGWIICGVAALLVLKARVNVALVIVGSALIGSLLGRLGLWGSCF